MSGHKNETSNFGDVPPTTEQQQPRPRKRDALFLAPTESSFSFGFGGDVSVGETATDDHEHDEDVLVNENDDDDREALEAENELLRGEGDEQPAANLKVVVSSSSSATATTTKTSISLDDVLRARNQFSGVAHGFFGITMSCSSSPQKGTTSSCVVKAAPRKTITREAHCRNVNYLFDRVRQEAAANELDREAARRRKLSNTSASSHNKSRGEATFYEANDE